MPTCDDLATKAELATLKDKINKILGAKGEGAYDNVIDDPSELLSLAPVAAVGTGLWLNKAFNSMYKIEVTAAGEGAIWKELANGTAQVTGFKGNGTSARVTGVEKVGAVAGQGVQIAGTATTAASHAAAAVNLLVSLVSIGGSLALNKATVDIFDQRIEAEAKLASDAINQVQSNTLRLYQSFQGDIDAINADVELNNDRIAAQNTIASDIRNDVNNQRIEFEYLGYQLGYAQDAINDLTLENDRLNQELIDFQAQAEAKIGALTDLVANLQNSLSEVSNQLYEAQNIIARHGDDILALQTRMDNQEYAIESLEATLTEHGQEIETLKNDFTQLRIDLGLEVPLNPDPKTYALIQIFRHETNFTQPGGGGGGAGVAIATEEAAKQQESLLKLGNKLSDTPIVIPPISAAEIRNGTSPFAGLFDELLPTINPSEVNQEQLDLQTQNLISSFETLLLVGLTTNVTPALNTITAATTETKIATGVQTGICNSLNGGGCPGTPGSPNPTQGLGGANNLLNNKLDGLNAAIGVADLAQGANILNIVKNTNQAVRHASYGLEKIQSFAATAWKATHADKILNVIGTAAAIHNAAMLSKGLGITIAETASSVLDAAGIEDSEGAAFDVGAIIKAKLDALLSHLVGEENYAALTAKIAKYNRIYQASAQVIGTVTGLIDSARSVNELTASYTGKIGNALINAGTVSENAYDRMLEKVRPGGGVLAKIDRYRQGIDDIEDKVSNIDSVAGEVKNTKSEFTELKDNYQTWETANEAVLTTTRADVEIVKNLSTTTAEPELEHFVRDATED